MNVVLIIPTGLGCEIGGHAGDGNPVAKLIGAACDTLITHPNVVNASDINEMPENALYVEGSILDRFLLGLIELKRVRQNKILVVVNSPVSNETINAVSAARATIGIDAEIIELEEQLRMIATMERDGASGRVYGVSELINQVRDRCFDALAISSAIDVDPEVAREYLSSGGINPWGGVEAKASKMIAQILQKPVAHAPFGDTLKGFNEVVNPRMAAEMVCTTYLHSVLKGLHKAPRVVSLGQGDWTVDDVDCMISPVDCYGPPHNACERKGIPIIVVTENRNKTNYHYRPDHYLYVRSYMEAAGFVLSMKAGLFPASLKRPIAKTVVIKKS